MELSKDAKERKTHPVATGVLDYFPDAIAAVAYVSYVGNQQHNPGQPLHWARGKSTDHADALMRHLLERGALDSDGVRHSAKVAWRALALLQEELENVARPAVDAVGSPHFAPNATTGQAESPAVPGLLSGSNGLLR